METFRKVVTGWLGKTLMVAMTLPFIIVSVESYFTGSGKVVEAKVNGVEIGQTEIDRLVERQRRTVLAQMGPNADPTQIDMKRLRQDVLNGLITRELITQQAQKNGFLVSDASVYQHILQEPAFQEDGKFNQKRYELMLSQSDENPATYPTQLKQRIASQLLVAGLNGSAFATTAEIDRVFALTGQKRDIHQASIPAARFLGSIQVSDDDIKKFYDANPQRFTSDETVSLDYIQIKRDDFLAQATLSEDDLRTRYDEKVKALNGREQRQAQHILIAVDAKTKDADALKKIQDIEKQARAGKDFGELAKAYSQDTGSAANGGDLGMVKRGGMNAPAFDNALFSLKEGEISAPVKTQYGYHLIKLDKIEKQDAPSFEAMRSQLEQEARAAKADELFSDEVDRIDTAMYEASDLKDPAEKFKLTINSAPPMTRSGAKEGVMADREVQKAAFSDNLIKDGKNSSVVRLADGSVVWLHVKSYQSSRLRPLTEISADVRNQLMQDKARDKAGELAAVISKAINGGASLADVAASNGLTWQDSPEATRRSPITPDVLQLAYRLPRPAEGKASADSLRAGDAYQVVAVTKVTDGSAPPEADAAQIRRAMAERRGEIELQDYVSALRADGKVIVSARKDSSAEDGTE